jgi:DUF438 domain-containing protein
MKLRAAFNALFDVDKLYKRKEYLIFPFLETKGITGPPKVMWGKHDEIRELIKGSIEVLQMPDISSCFPNITFGGPVIPIFSKNGKSRYSLR